MATPVISGDGVFSHVFIGASDVQKSVLMNAISWATAQENCCSDEKAGVVALAFFYLIVGKSDDVINRYGKAIDQSQ